MNSDWTAVAQQTVHALGVQAGEVIELVDQAGRYDVLLEFVLAIEQRGATPRVEILPPELIARLVASTPSGSLAGWDRHRAEWMRNTDRILALESGQIQLNADPAALETWIQATNRVTVIEEERKLPFVLVAIPTETTADSLGLDLQSLEDVLLPGLNVPSERLRAEIDRTLQALNNTQSLTVRTGSHELELDIRGRHWLQDAGEIPEIDGPHNVQPVVNLPAGSVYTTVVEHSASGSLLIPKVNDASDVVFEFVDGRVVEISAGSDGETVSRIFDEHTGEPRRISHLGIGLNPNLHRTLGWPLVDEHRHGALFIAFGENRYLGGENESSLNVDFVIPEGTLLADGRVVVSRGELLDH